MASQVVALPAALGLRSVASPAMEKIIRGPRASRPVKVSWIWSKYKYDYGYNDEWYHMSVNMLINAYVLVSLHTPPPRIETTLGPACPNCGTIKKSGKLSCCAPGGTWFETCGKVVDSNFGHTWSEGIEACESTRMTYCASACVSR